MKTSLAPGSQVVAQYLEKSGLQKPLDKLGFNLVGFGCTTCIGNSGPLAAPISKVINDNDIVVASVLSGNRNFEGRVNPDVQANYLASPPLVVAFALAGTVAIDLDTQPLGHDKKGRPVFLRDIWPSNEEIARFIRKNVTRSMFRDTYANVFDGDAHWRKVKAPEGETYVWDGQSTYVRNPPYFEGLTKDAEATSQTSTNARILALFGDKITTDHISPAGSIKAGLARRQMAYGAGRRAGGFQSIWHAARQSRSHDAWHFRKYSHQEFHDEGRSRQCSGGWTDQTLSRRRDSLHLRCGDEICEGGQAARRICGRRIWQWLVARLGGQGNDAARRARRHRAELRAHPPLQFGRHGRAAAHLRAWNELGVARADAGRKSSIFMALETHWSPAKR